MTLYVAVRDGYNRSFVNFEQALLYVSCSNNYFVLSVRKGKTMLCAHSFNAFLNSTPEGNENQHILLRLKTHFEGYTE